MKKDLIFNEIAIHGTISRDTALTLYYHDMQNREYLYDMANEVSHMYAQKRFEFCSIINAKSGLCPEDCKWCAQASRYKTNVEQHGVINGNVALKQAMDMEQHGVKRFSLVTSGRKPNEAELEKLCQNIKFITGHSNMMVCASMGLLNEKEMQMLKDAGVVRYHCNLETAPSFFDSLCTTHNQKDKIKTLKSARNVGLDICCGGIIGMGENIEQRIDFAIALHNVGSLSIPINILQPIKGTPLENIQPITETEILDFLAMLRLINPKATIRFAAGRIFMSKECQIKAHRIGVNAAIVGNMLTTIGTQIDEDKKMFCV